MRVRRNHIKEIRGHCVVNGKKDIEIKWFADVDHEKIDTTKTLLNSRGNILGRNTVSGLGSVYENTSIHWPPASSIGTLMSLVLSR